VVRDGVDPAAAAVSPSGTSTTAPLAETRRELVDKFSGVTAYVRSPGKGLWTAPDGHTEADDVVMVEVVTETFDRGWWRTYATTLATGSTRKRFMSGRCPWNCRTRGRYE
jgi:hypothetical protein